MHGAGLPDFLLVTLHPSFDTAREPREPLPLFSISRPHLPFPPFFRQPPAALRVLYNCTCPGLVTRPKGALLLTSFPSLVIYFTPLARIQVPGARAITHRSTFKPHDLSFNI
ncbi:hypothetical protein DTO271G3_1470 [Paecilomyces variotii]|nr:hypothetical protein DTO271G3_1470 [Paecilomyces variotii]